MPLSQRPPEVNARDCAFRLHGAIGSGDVLPISPAHCTMFGRHSSNRRDSIAENIRLTDCNIEKNQPPADAGMARAC